MKKSLLGGSVAVFFIVSFFIMQTTLYAQETVLSVQEISVCLDIVDHTCVDKNDVFPSQVGKLFCLTRIFGAQEDSEVTHVWVFGDVERARVKLGVRSVNFRTFSSKIIRPHEIGDWRVDVLGPDESLLKSVKFEIVP